MTALRRGVWSAVLTPADERFRPDAAKAIDYYGRLLRDGIDGLNVLGTNGEAASFGIRQRLDFMEALARSGLPRERIMIGTGTTSLDDTATLTRAAFDCGFAAALVMPPFFYRSVSDDGIVAFFEALLARSKSSRCALLLYNFPAASGVTFHATLVDRLVGEFPGAIAGIKDSSNDRALQKTIVERHPQLAVLPSSEEELAGARCDGRAGCISGSVALWPRLAADVWHGGSGAERLADLRRAIAAPDMLVAVRYLTSKLRNDASWERPMPPLTTLPDERKRDLDELFGRV